MAFKKPYFKNYYNDYENTTKTTTELPEHPRFLPRVQTWFIVYKTDLDRTLFSMASVTSILVVSPMTNSGVPLDWAMSKRL